MSTLSPFKAIGIELFSGAGGLSLGAHDAGVRVLKAYDVNISAMTTYSRNLSGTECITQDVRTLDVLSFPDTGMPTILFGGPPCQGFSTSNQRTRNRLNPGNSLCFEVVRLASISNPDWVVVENVKGILETDSGSFRRMLVDSLEKMGYTCAESVLNSFDFGVPQIRWRYFLVASRHGKECVVTPPTNKTVVTVRDAIEDLPSLENGASTDRKKYPRDATSPYAVRMRGGRKMVTGNIVTANAQYVVERYKHVPPGGNWKDIPAELMGNYANRKRCHTGIYRRLDPDKPSVVLGNYRKNMLIHPWEERGLSVREAARLQSFPDWFRFFGTIGQQQQQVGNAVPPMLSRAVFETILSMDDEFRKSK